MDIFWLSSVSKCLFFINIFLKNVKMLRSLDRYKLGSFCQAFVSLKSMKKLQRNLKLEVDVNMDPFLCQLTLCHHSAAWASASA